MDAGKLYGRGISFPPRVGEDGRVAWSAGEENIRDAIRVILLTEPGERLLRPDFGAGLRRFLFEPNTVTTRRAIEDAITVALKDWEARIAVESVTVEEEPDDPRAVLATVTYRLVATSAVERVSLSVGVAG
ncbi:GPW/gp25 family protein [Sorangium sp. So ce448]|uniref:GPW/gp25 family protein n=1 Tax=Sorangium sp. So ce448 TaxID=3133314 RepID=UPI003F62AF2B